MAVIYVTAENWNSSAFWSSVNISPGDTIDFSGLPSTFRVEMSSTDGRLRITDTTGPTNNDLYDWELGSGTLSDLDNFIGPTGGQVFFYGLDDGSSETFTASTANDQIAGNAGDDTIDGGAGDDFLTGGDGADSIIGGDGADLIYGDNYGPNTTLYVTSYGELRLYDNDTGQSIDTGAYSDLSKFGDIAQTPDGALYGIKLSSAPVEDLGIYSIDPVGQTSTKIWDFPDDAAHAGLSLTSDFDGNLYYVKMGDGHLYRLNSDGAGGFTSEQDLGDIPAPYDSTIKDIAFIDNDTFWVVGGDFTSGLPFLQQYTINGAGVPVFDQNIASPTADSDISSASLGADGLLRVFEESGEVWVTDPNTVSWTLETAQVAWDVGTANNVWGATSYVGQTYDAATGGDTIDGGTGDDTIYAGSGDDSVTGGDGNDTVDGGDGADSISGGTGDDSLTGGDGDDTFTYAAGDGNDTITDFNTGNTGTLDDGDNTNNDFINLSGFYDGIWELHADQADDGILNQSNDGVGGVDYSDNTSFAGGSLTFTGASADDSFFTVENTGVVCFTEGTMILTPVGEVPIETLRPGDLICTADNGPKPLQWIGRRSLTFEELQANPKNLPIFLRQGTLGLTQDTLFSPQHGLVVAQDHLVRAKHLVDALPGVRIARGKRSVTYIHLLLEQHEILFANGAQCESLFLGPMALGAMSCESREQLLTLFPELIHSETADCAGATLVARRFGNAELLKAERPSREF